MSHLAQEDKYRVSILHFFHFDLGLYQRWVQTVSRLFENRKKSESCTWLLVLELVWLRWHTGTDENACHGVSMVTKLNTMLICMYNNNRFLSESPSHLFHGVDLMVNLQDIPYILRTFRYFYKIPKRVNQTTGIYSCLREVGSNVIFAAYLGFPL